MPKSRSQKAKPAHKSKAGGAKGTRAKQAFADPSRSPRRPSRHSPGGHPYGWTPDAPDDRDHRYTPPSLGALPAKMSLRAHFPPPYTQGQIKSCCACAVAAAIQFDRAKQGLPSSKRTPSRLFIYYNARALEGKTQFDAPCQVRNAVKGAAAHGACFEGNAADEWPYVIARFKKRPPAACFKAAMKDRALRYRRLTVDIHHLKSCLASGYPFIFGFTAYASIEKPAVMRTGHVPLPAAHEEVLGGHVILAVGYDDAKRQILFRNSWGPKWGDGGYGTIPYDYVLDPRLARDFWTVQLMSPSAGT